MAQMLFLFFLIIIILNFVHMTCSKHIRLSLSILPSNTSSNNNSTTSSQNCSTTSFKDVLFNHNSLFNILLYLPLFNAIQMAKVSKFFCIYFRYQRLKGDSVLWLVFEF